MTDLQQLLADIIAVEELPITTQEAEKWYIKELNRLYLEVNRLLDSPVKRAHDEEEGNNYHIVLTEEGLVYKHRVSGFAPRYIIKDK